MEVQSPTLVEQALIGIYRGWREEATLAVGYLAGRHWYDEDRSLSRLNAHVHSFFPRLDPSVQRYFLQGIGRLLFSRLSATRGAPLAEVERFPQAFQQGLLEGWGMALGEHDLFSGYPWRGRENPFWTASIRGSSERSTLSLQHGREQFEALFE